MECKGSGDCAISISLGTWFARFSSREKFIYIESKGAPMNVHLIAVLAGAGLAAMAAMAQTGSGAASKLKGKRVAILCTDGFEQPEMVEPRKALDDAGAKTTLIAPKSGQIKAWNKTDWGEKFTVDLALEEAKVDQFDALLLPGGVINPDKLRMNPKAVEFVKAFFAAGKPVAAICHAPIMLIEADVVRGRKLTSWPSLKTDLRNAGASWEDSEVIVDRNLVTSRKPEDIPAFNRQMIEIFAEAKARNGAK
jgi:protease I